MERQAADYLSKDRTLNSSFQQIAIQSVHDKEMAMKLSTISAINNPDVLTRPSWCDAKYALARIKEASAMLI